MINRQRIYAKYQGRCAYTGKPLGDDWQVDHIIPRAMSVCMPTIPNKLDEIRKTINDVQN